VRISLKCYLNCSERKTWGEKGSDEEGGNDKGRKHLRK
jgi:hypothetical protein